MKRRDDGIDSHGAAPFDAAAASYASCLTGAVYLLLVTGRKTDMNREFGSSIVIMRSFVERQTQY
jgi:hypothetical protein